MTGDRPTQPHDGLIRTALSFGENARSALAAALPVDLVAHLDLARPTRLPARTVDKGLTAREADALWEIPFRHVDRTLVVHVLAEAQSTPDADIVLRFLRQQVHLWEDQRRAGKELSPVIPLVISHGATWREPRTMLERLRLPREIELLVAAYTPASTYALEDLARFTTQDLAARPELSTELRVTYFLLQRSRASRSFEEDLALILRDLRVLSEEPAAREHLTRLLSYTYYTANGDLSAVHSVLRDSLAPEMEIQMGTLADQLIERGIERGIQTGRAEGIRDGQREMLMRQLALKFGVLPGAVGERLARASSDELAAYVLRILTAESLEAVFEGV